MKYLKHLITACCVTLLLIIYSGTNANAHWADSAVGEMTITQNAAKFSLTLPTELLALADDNNDRQISQNEIQRNQVQLIERLNSQIQLTTQRGEVGKLEQIRAGQSEPSTVASTHSSIVMNYRWEKSIEGLKAVYKFFPPDAPNARSVITVSHQGKTQSAIFSPAQPTQELLMRSTWQQVMSFGWLGTEHMMTGYDHVLFIVGLVLLGKTHRSRAKLLTIFTLAYSLMLSLAALNIVVLPAQLVESVIALSIVYIAVAAIWIWLRQLRFQWLIILGLGLFHGLGFGGMFQELSISVGNLAFALPSFTLGLVLGQVPVLLACLVVNWLVQQIRLVRVQQHYLNCAIAAGLGFVGCIWFMQRFFML